MAISISPDLIFSSPNPLKTAFYPKEIWRFILKNWIQILKLTKVLLRKRFFPPNNILKWIEATIFENIAFSFINFSEESCGFAWSVYY